MIAIVEGKREQINNPPPEKRKLSAEEILAMQPASTRANMGRKKPRDWNAPVKNWRADRDADAVFAKTGHKMGDIQHAASVRQTPKNTLGQSEKSGPSEEARTRAAHAFMVTPAVKAEDIPNEAEIVGLVKMLSQPPPKEEWRKLSPIKAFWHWLCGGKVKNEKVENEE